MPVISSVTVASGAASVTGTAAIKSSNPTATKTVLVLKSVTSAANYTAPLA